MPLSPISKILKNPSLWLVALVVFAVVKPAKAPDINRYMGMGVWAFAAVVFLGMFLIRGRCLDYWQRYRKEIILVAAFLFLHLLSLLLNLDVYPDFKALVFYGIAPLAVFSLFGMAWGIFSIYPVSRGICVPVFFLLIHGVALGQFFDYELFRPITSHTIAADIMHPGYITSVFPHHTIYGTVAAVNIIYGLTLLFGKSLSRDEKYLWLAVISMAFVGGALSHSRNFLWTLGFGVLPLFFFFERRRLGLWLATLLLAVAAFHVVAYYSPGIQRQYGRALPYLGKLAKPAEIEGGDFVPRFSSQGLTGRPELWRRAYGQWQQAPWFGKGPGSFNLSGGNLYSRQFNVHCFYLQVLLDTGIVGFIVLAVLLFLLLKRARLAGILPVFVAVLASLVFDNFLDHSMAWAILMAWFVQPQPLPENIGRG
ncbi:MAG: O-antigen ligase family protein [Desulfobulbaceae bacterium]|nr:O-antigen ligase family protein [Desulfobulbaceae bacterium]